jgi:hypothetical protein
MGSEENSSQAPFLSNYSSTLAASAQKIIIYIWTIAEFFIFHFSQREKKIIVKGK